MRLCLIGPERLRPKGVEIWRHGTRSLSAREASIEPGWIGSYAPQRWDMGRVQADCGRASIEALRIGHELALSGNVDALVTCPANKEALQLAGEKVEGQTELLGQWCGATRYEMMAIAGNLRVMLLTRHMPLRAALDAISAERVLDRLMLFSESLERFGVSNPRLALAGLNPHAGEGGVLGTEEEGILRPAVEAARSRGIRVAGPLSADSVFMQASRGEFDGVLALYHDQAFIPVKLLSKDGGVTVIAGLPYLRVSPVHGTAFDIAGRGLASPANLIAALLQAAQWAGRPR